MSETFFDQLFDKFNQVNVAVIGDVMLDVYLWGEVDRISPEAPVPVVSLKRKEMRLGGAANVALNLRALGAEVQIFSLVGDDDDGHELKRLFEERSIITTGLLQTANRITTSKTRIISRSQQMLRLDAEETQDITPRQEQRLFQQIKKTFETGKPNVVIFEDYNKGVLTQSLIQQIIELCNQMDIPTCVDPKLKNFFAYQHVTIFKPNLKEVREGLHLLSAVISNEELKNIHRELQEKLSHQISFITLSEKGVFYQHKNQGELIASHLRNIADVSGAGDTVIATAAIVWALTKDAKLMAEIANIAGGLVCEEVGVVAINKELLKNECKLLLTQN